MWYFNDKRLHYVLPRLFYDDSEFLRSRRTASALHKKG
ncbi:Uncharacterized protein dnm_021660 [Desulfonema magnum]|uniref:Uncharacterized protein n=1 Tax=Desulfonema magnum TaxID=45655 RepID=A0A975GM06_9BACT|nr:Uncharacterized protein dnm_021660 [Desulfonema magnum]